MRLGIVGGFPANVIVETRELAAILPGSYIVETLATATGSLMADSGWG